MLREHSNITEVFLYSADYLKNMWNFLFYFLRELLAAQYDMYSRKNIPNIFLRKIFHHEKFGVVQVLVQRSSSARQYCYV